jgi:hypothetical protein
MLEAPSADADGITELGRTEGANYLGSFINSDGSRIGANR